MNTVERIRRKVITNRKNFMLETGMDEIDNLTAYNGQLSAVKHV